MANLIGTNASETVTGTSESDTLTGLGGNDTLRGLEGNDVYAFSGAFGSDQIFDTGGVDQIRIGADYSNTDFRLVRVSDGLRISQVNGGQTIDLDNFFNPNVNANFRGAVESVVFDRTGVVWDLGNGAAFINPGFFGTNASETITGSSGIDVIFGLGGNDALRGLEGDDFYGFFGAFGRDSIIDPAGVDQVRIAADYSELDFRAVRAGNDLVIQQTNNAQAITLENFFNPAVNLNFRGAVESVGFDRTGTIWDLSSGQVVVRPGFFDYNGYLSANADVRAAGLDAYTHYITSGWREGRDPSASFDTTLYLLKNPDVAAAGVNPLRHYLDAGQFEGRVASPAVGSVITGGFDAQYYLLANPDVGLAGIDAASHYATSGWREGRDPSFLFDTSYYLARHADVAAAGINPLAHYTTLGWREGRDPSAAFDTTAYQRANPDVAAAQINPLQHYLERGVFEGRLLGDIGIA